MIPDKVLHILKTYDLELANLDCSFVLSENTDSVSLTLKWTKVSMPYRKPNVNTSKASDSVQAPPVQVIRKHKSPSQLRYDRKRRREWKQRKRSSHEKKPMSPDHSPYPRGSTGEPSIQHEDKHICNTVSVEPVCEKLDAKPKVQHQQPTTFAPVLHNTIVNHVSSHSVPSPGSRLKAARSVPTSVPEACVSIDSKDMLAFLTGKRSDLPQKLVYK